MALNPGPFSRIATDTVSGLLSTVAQNIAGAKSFLAAASFAAGITVTGAAAISGNVTAANLSGTNTGDVTVTTPLQRTGQALSILAATGSNPGTMSAADFTKLATYPGTYVAPTAPTVTSVTVANGLGLTGGVLSMSVAASGVTGAMLGTDKTKLDTYPGTYSAPTVTGVTAGNGLSLSGTNVVMAAASGSVPGAMSSSDFTKLAGYPAYSAPVVTAVTATNGLTLSSGTLAITFAAGATTGTVSAAAQTFNGAKTFASAPIFSAGAQTASLFNTNGTGSTDIATLHGFTTADGSVSSTAKLASFGTGIGGTYVEKVFIGKVTSTFNGSLSIVGSVAGATTMYVKGAPGQSANFFQIDNNSNVALFTLDPSANASLPYGSLTVGSGAAAATQSAFGSSTYAHVLSVYGPANGSAQGPIFARARTVDTIGTALTLDASAPGGDTWNFLSTGPAAGFGAGHFAFFQSSLAQYRLLVRSDGLLWTRGISGQTSVNLFEAQNAGGSVMFSVGSTGVITSANDVRSSTGAFKGASAANGALLVDDSTGSQLSYTANYRLTMTSTSLDMRGGGNMRIASSIGTGSTDIAQSMGFTTLDGSVHSSARIASWRVGIGSGTEVEYAYLNKTDGLAVKRLTMSPATTDGTTAVNAPFKIPLTGSNQSSMIILGAGTTTSDWELKIGMYTGAGAPIITTRAAGLFFDGPTGAWFVPVSTNAIDLGITTNAWRHVFATDFESTTVGGSIVIRDSTNVRWRIAVSTVGVLTAVPA